MKAKMGRPALPVEEVRQTFTIRVSAAERAELVAAAEHAGRPVTQWARHALLTLARSVDTPPAPATLR